MGPKYEQPPLDPTFQATQARADADRTRAIQGNLADYQTRMLQRYGATAALSGASTPSPLTVGALMTSGRSPAVAS